MSETTIETDYLVVGSGAVGMAFTDSLVHETDDRLLVVDRHHGPGGHWNDAYPFVRLHQPSAYYGLNSMALGGDGLDADPLNPGMTERATSAQIIDYYERALAAMLATGRVSYHPMSFHAMHENGTHRITSQLSGITTRVHVRKKIVDTTYLHTAVPATHRSTPWQKASPACRSTSWHGCGRLRTASSSSVPARRVPTPACGSWVKGSRPTGSPGSCRVTRGSRTEPTCSPVRSSSSTPSEPSRPRWSRSPRPAPCPTCCRAWSRPVSCYVYPTVEPGMHHAAVVSEAELEALRTILNVVRLGRVQRIERDRIVLVEGSVAADPGALYVDCSASAAELRPPVPVFSRDTITPQFVRSFQPTFSAAMIAWVEAHHDDESVKNEICGVCSTSTGGPARPTCSSGWRGPASTASPR